MFEECHAHVIMDGINYKAAVAASICFLSARDSFFFVFTGCTVFSSVFPNIRCSHWNRSHRSHKVDLDHTAINNDKDTDIQRPHGNANKEGLEPQSEQRSQIHFHQSRFQIGHN